MKWNILYRGPLSSCNYECSYCPFAKTKNTRAELLDDEQKLLKFEAWVNAQQQHNIGILFTPWGEGLIRKHYQQVMTRLSHQPMVDKVAIQTNLSSTLDWMREVNTDAFALWTTFHPTQISLSAYLDRCEKLNSMGINYSVGMVGLKEDFELIQEMRDRLAPHVYLWVNAYKREEGYYTEEDLNFLNKIDPHFHFNAVRHPSYGEACRAGYSSFSIDGDGAVTRCHFIKNKLGNIYETPLEEMVKRTPCSNDTCGCYIGYINMDKLGLDNVYQGKILERIAI
ncbi:STM4011 family radical SAM protein [Limibacter armeniacum]|uniref:STM4011 family radical SAM protein n=1 Tax=Limibacter armeniacum TaxID=466084 RepID=UPI002FE68F67